MYEYETYEERAALLRAEAARQRLAATIGTDHVDRRSASVSWSARIKRFLAQRPMWHAR